MQILEVGELADVGGQWAQTVVFNIQVLQFGQFAQSLGHSLQFVITDTQ